jgi:hypothetical protein
MMVVEKRMGRNEFLPEQMTESHFRAVEISLGRLEPSLGQDMEKRF